MEEKQIVNQARTINSLKPEFVKLKATKNCSKETIIDKPEENKNGDKTVEKLLIGFFTLLVGLLVSAVAVVSSEYRKK